MQFKLFIHLLPVCLVACIFFRLGTFSNVQKNRSPVVRIVAPANKSKFQWNTLLQYKISVDDAEDGNSEYGEIAMNEVLLKVTYLADSSRAKKYLLEQSKQISDPPGLALMKVSTCFNCHNSKSKLIGPSLELIAKRYPRKATIIESLAQRIITGSTGIWGNTAMPPHPELKIDMAKEMVSWILENNADPDTYYLTGITGALRTREKQQHGATNGVYVLTASYEDHGINDMRQFRKRGQHSVILIQ